MVKKQIDLFGNEVPPEKLKKGERGLTVGPLTDFRGAFIPSKEVKALIEAEKSFGPSMDDAWFQLVDKLELGWDDDYMPAQFYVTNNKIEGIAISDYNSCSPCNRAYCESAELDPERFRSDYCSNCGIKELPSSLLELEHLKELYIKANTSTSIKNNNLPDWIQKIETLETLRLNAIGSSKLSTILGKLTNLKVLRINNYDLRKIPSTLIWLKKLKILDLRHCRLQNSDWRRDIEVLGDLKQLECLYLDGNSLERLPNMSKLRHLKILSVIKTERHLKPLEVFPISICNINSLKELYLDGNAITNIPDAIGRLINLKVLSLNNTKITSLPETIGNLKNLKVLNLNNCRLNSIPDGITQLPSLRTLEIRGNILPGISQEVTTYLLQLGVIPQKDKDYLQMDKTQAQALYEIETKLKSKLNKVQKLNNLKGWERNSSQNEYIVENNEVTALRLHYIFKDNHKLLQVIQNLKSLKTLEIITGEKISTIPSFIGDFENLESLKLINLGITEISNLEKLVQLKTLDLSFNQISEIKGLETLTNLKKLSLNYNQITEIKGLDKLTILTDLDLSNNEIKEIKGLDNLHKLTDLDLRSNNIEEIKGLENLTDLRDFGFYGNKFPKALIDQIIDDVLDHRDKFVYYCQRKTVTTKNLKYEFVTAKGKKYYVWNKKLRIYKEELTSIDEIKGLKNLKDIEVLDLSYNKIPEIKGLENLIYLKELRFAGNQIGEIKGLDNLTRLEYLDLSSNKIKGIEGLDALHNLKELYLNQQPIRDLKGIGHLRKLEKFSIHLSERFWNDLKEEMGEDFFNEIGVSYGGFNIKNLKKLLDYCKLKEGNEDLK